MCVSKTIESVSASVIYWSETTEECKCVSPERKCNPTISDYTQEINSKKK